MKMNLVKIIAKTPIEDRVNKEVAGIYERNIKNSITLKEKYKSKFMSEYFDKAIERNIEKLAKGGYSHIARKYAI
jgi:hypothetical protein